MHQDIDNAFNARQITGTSSEYMYAGALSFARRHYSKDLTNIDLAITGVPFDTATTNRPGARLGPRAIREMSTNLAWERHWPWDFDPFELLRAVDYGDCFFDHGYPSTVPEQIAAHARHILSHDVGLLSLGGDHFISWPLLQAHYEKYGPMSLLHFDAHSDTWEDEDGRIDHGTMFYHAIKQGLIVPEQSIQVGLRTTNESTMGMNIRDAAWVHSHDDQALIDDIKEVVGDRPVYMTFDIDCIDPAFAPGTGTPVCGGMTSNQALTVLRGLRGINVIGMDVVEVSPPYDHAGVTALLAATIAYEMVCLYAARHKRDERF